MDRTEAMPETFVGFVGNPLTYFLFLPLFSGSFIRRGVTIKTYKSSPVASEFNAYLTEGRPPVRVSLSVNQPYSTKASIAA